MQKRTLKETETQRRTEAQAQAACEQALRGLFVGDALSMPVHWYYRQADIVKAFPPNGITRMQPAPALHPGSIMSLHSRQRGGRSKRSATSLPPVVGSVILHGREQHWDRPGVHYHHGLAAGENTLNAWCARLMMAWIARQRQYDASQWLDAYIDFMTAVPPRHPDTYAESYHREFFANWQQGVEPLRCGGVTHDTPSMGALVTVAPLALWLLQQGLGNIVAGVDATAAVLHNVQDICSQHVFLTHPDAQLSRVVAEYVELLYRLVWTDAPVTELFLAASGAAGGNGIKAADLTARRGDGAIVGGRYSLACYITDSWPSVCYLAARYSTSPAAGLLANTNLGGENAHRGAVLGTLLGAATRGRNGAHRHSVNLDTESRTQVGDTNSAGDVYDPEFDALFRQLRHGDALAQEIAAWSDVKA